MTIQSRIKSLEHIKASDLIRNEKNFRKHPAKQERIMRGMLDEIGYADALLGRRLADGRVELLDGHLRAGISGDAVVPVLLLDLTDDEADKLLAFLDRITVLAKEDKQAAARLISGLQFTNESLSEYLDSWKEQVRNYMDDPLIKMQEKTVLDQAVQLKPAQEFILVVCENDSEFEELRILLNLRTVRRGGYPPGDMYDATGTQRVVKARTLLTLLPQNGENPETVSLPGEPEQPETPL